MVFIKNAIKRSCLYRVIQHARMLSRLSIAQWTKRGRRMLRFYSQFIKPGDLCFDIGANVGIVTKMFLKLGAAKVLAVEPQAQIMDNLRIVYGRNQRVTLLQKALGEAEDQAEMMICSSAPAITSLSNEWIDSVKASGRFSNYTWDKKQIVQVTTLDKLIEQHGVPSFVKIDVEGYEYQVIQGLTKPVHTLSLEFTPEFIESTLQCVEYLSTLGNIRFNYTLAEPSMLELCAWVTAEQMIQILLGYPKDYKPHGDLYARFIES